MSSLLEFNLKRSITNKLRESAIEISPETMEVILSATWRIVGNLEDQERLLRLRQYQFGLETERKMIQSIINADENIGEPYYETLKKVKNYLSHFKKPNQHANDDDGK